MGHEFCGEIVGAKRGADTSSNRFVCNAVVGCGSCMECRRKRDYLCPDRQVFGMNRPGAFTEYVAVPERALIGVPDTVSASEACLAEPLGNGVHVYRAVKAFDHENVVVLGAGPIGLFCQQVFQAMGKSNVVVSDPKAERRVASKTLGALGAVDPTGEDLAQQSRRFFNGSSPDVVIDAVGSAVTKRQSIQIVRQGGVVVWIGLHENSIELDTYDITLEEKAILGTYGASQSDLAVALDLIQKGSVDAASWTSVYSLSNGVDAFLGVAHAKSNDIKVIIRPQEH